MGLIDEALQGLPERKSGEVLIQETLDDLEQNFKHDWLIVYRGRDDLRIFLRKSFSDREFVSRIRLSILEDNVSRPGVMMIWHKDEDGGGDIILHLRDVARHLAAAIDNERQRREYLDRKARGGRTASATQSALDQATDEISRNRGIEV